MMQGLHTVLRAHQPIEEPDAPGLAWAAVALVVRGVTLIDAELLFIRRAARAGDPWSGHIAFPGGRRESADASLQITAERETREELSLDLHTSGTWLGVLSDMSPRSPALPSIAVRPYVYHLHHDVTLIPNHEVASAFWVPVSALQDPANASEFSFERHGDVLRFPAYNWHRDVIWGMTERITAQLLQLAEAVRV
jgi:8-oxo-dGTP pyrophosphatase MutT (NUDIX family)